MPKTNLSRGAHIIQRIRFLSFNVFQQLLYVLGQEKTALFAPQQEKNKTKNKPT